MIFMVYTIYTYKNKKEFEYIRKNYPTIACNINHLNQMFNYSTYNYIDITEIIQYFFYNPQNKIILHNLEEDLEYGVKAIIHENLVNIALNMCYTLFNEEIKISDEIPELKNLEENMPFKKKILYYYNDEEYFLLWNSLNKKNIPLFDIRTAYYMEIVDNYLFDSNTVINITACFTNNNPLLIDYLIKISQYPITLICNHEKCKDEILHHFKEIKHISKKYDFIEDKKIFLNNMPLKITDLNEIEFKNIMKKINEQLIGHERFKMEFFTRLSHFRELNNLNLKKIFSVFIFGSSGVGKTELARILNKNLNENMKLIKINFGNYTSENSLNNLIGSPRGYIGSEEGELSIKLNKSHNGVILCDEFEKADAKIINFFLELLEEGKFTDSQSREYDLNGYVIIFTSNLDKNSYLNNMPNEFKSRIELLTHFNHLTDFEKKEFVSLEFTKIKQKIESNEKYSSVNLNEFNFQYDLNNKNNLREIKRELHNQIIKFINDNKPKNVL